MAALLRLALHQWMYRPTFAANTTADFVLVSRALALRLIRMRCRPGGARVRCMQGMFGAIGRTAGAMLSAVMPCRMHRLCRRSIMVLGIAATVARQRRAWGMQL